MNADVPAFLVRAPDPLGPLLGKAEPPRPATPVDNGPLIGKAEPPPIPVVPYKPDPPPVTVGRTLTVPAVRQAPPTYPPQAKHGRSHTTPTVTYPPQWKR